MNRTDLVLRQKLAARLREEREKHFGTAAEAARALRKKEASYVHYENGRRGIPRELVPHLGRLFRVNPAYFLVLGASREVEASARPMADIPILAEAAVGVWREASVDNMPHAKEKKLSIPPEVEWSATDEYAVQIVDESINRVIPKDAWVICRPLRPGPIDTSQFEVDDIVHVERIRRGGLKEISIRRVSERHGAQLTLSTYSSEKKYRGGSVTYPAKDGRDGVIIKGVMTAFYVRPARRHA